MALMVDADRREVWQKIMQVESAESRLVSILKTELRAAVDAADQWVSDNQVSYNTAIPQPARGALTTAQKARILMCVLEQRYLKGV